MKNKWSNYALKDGKVQSSYIREYSNRKKIRKTGEASNSDSNEQSWKEQTQEEVNQEEKNVTDRTSSDERRSRGDEESPGGILAMQSVSKKQPKRKRKKTGPEGTGQRLETK